MQNLLLEKEFKQNNINIYNIIYIIYIKGYMFMEEYMYNWSLMNGGKTIEYLSFNPSQIGRDCKIHWLHLCSEVSPPLTPNEGPRYDIKASEASTLEIWGMQSTPSLPLRPGPLWPGVVAPDRVLSMGQIEQTVYKQMTDVKLWLLYSNIWNYLPVCKKEFRLI